MAPAAWMEATARASPSASRTSACTVTRSAPASRNHGSCSNGLSIIRCTSSGSDVAFFNCFTIGTPMVRFGTKCPSMTSTCTYPAPASSMRAMSRPRFMKSADRMDGAIFTGSNMRNSLSGRCRLFDRPHSSATPRATACPAGGTRRKPHVGGTASTWKDRAHRHYLLQGIGDCVSPWSPAPPTGSAGGATQGYGRSKRQKPAPMPADTRFKAPSGTCRRKAASFGWTTQVMSVAAAPNARAFCRHTWPMKLQNMSL